MFHFAWVDAGTAFSAGLARDDEVVVSFAVTHDEGGFAQASITLRNPRVGLLNAARKRWVWLSMAEGLTLTPLFFGRLMGVPENLQNEVLTITLLARPADYDAQKRTLAESLRVVPYWDPVWIDPTRRDDPESVLESRPQLWHVDRVSHAVSVSNIINGEDGVVDIAASDVVAGSLSVTYRQPPLRRVKVTAEVLWVQQAQGVVDASKMLLAAFAAAGGPAGFVTSFTGEGLYNDWPQPQSDIGGGWSFGDLTITPVDGTVVPLDSYALLGGALMPRDSLVLPVIWEKAPTDLPAGRPVTDSVQMIFPFSHFQASLPLVYQAERNCSETLTFDLAADVQSVLFDESETEVETLSFSSSEITQPIDAGGALPIGDVRRPQYFTLDRGQDSIAYLLAVARSRLLSRARVVEVEVQIPFELATTLSCRKSASLALASLLGGAALGKIVSYGFDMDGASGQKKGKVKLACCIGRGNVAVAVAGTPSFVELGVLELGVQQALGETVMPIAGAVTYARPTALPEDDGVDFFTMLPADVISTLSVTNGPNVQRALTPPSPNITGYFIDIAAAIAAMNEIYTTVDLVMKPVTAGPFAQSYSLSPSVLSVPKTFDLEA